MFSALFLWSCGNQRHANDHDHDHSHEHEHDHDEEGEGHNHETEALQLNEGKKWMVNEEMKPHIDSMKMLLDNFTMTNAESFHVLSASLAGHNQNLISSCTMKGPSHDELHKWLHPHMERVEKLAQISTEEQGVEVFNAINESFKEFDEFFE